MMKHVFTGFGFGPIQSGLFVKEAFFSGNFSRLVVAEVDARLVAAVRANKGAYYVNIGKSDGIETVKVENIEILNPSVEADRAALLDALAQSTEITTCLPSVSFFTMGQNSVASLIAQGLEKTKSPAIAIYAAENNNHAAEILQDAVRSPLRAYRLQYLNTVIGKMSQVVTDAAVIKEMNLAPIAPGIDRAFLVEEFNHILVTRCTIAGFRPGIEVFIEKDDLLPFEEAKLYGHNAIHALLAYLAALKGYVKMTELKGDDELMEIGHDAFINESGGALIKKYANLGDELFTPAGYKFFAEDLLERMTNPWLNDTVERAGRNPVRKLGSSDRIFGTMSLALEFGIMPANMALGAIAGIAELLARPDEAKLPSELRCDFWKELDNARIAAILNWLWSAEKVTRANDLIVLTQQALPRLRKLLNK